MKIAVIGAGAAGLAAARCLQSVGKEVVLYEKSEEVGGRAATRQLYGCAFDHGAQYIRSTTPELDQLLRYALPHDELFDIGRPVWVFGEDGSITEGDPAQNAEPKLTYRSGLNQLGKLLAHGLTIQTEVGISKISGRRGAYTLADSAGNTVGSADVILIAIPAGQASALLAASNLPDTDVSALQAALNKANYTRCLSVALNYALSTALFQQRPYYALVNTDKRHPISWVAFEEDKGPLRIPAGQHLLIVQMAPQFSEEHWETPPEQLTTHVAGLASTLFGQDLQHPQWSDVKRWRYALPTVLADEKTLTAASSNGLYFAGDYLRGARVHLALESGLAIARAIASA